MRRIIDIKHAEFFDVGSKVSLSEEFGVIVKTHETNKKGFITREVLIVRWDTNIEADYESISRKKESLLKKVKKEHKFKYINEDGTEKN